MTESNPIRDSATAASEYFAALHPDWVHPANSHWSDNEASCVGAHLARMLGLRIPHRHVTAGADAWAAALGANRAHAVLMLRAAGAPHDPFGRHEWTVEPAAVFFRVASLETLPPLAGADLSRTALWQADLSAAALAGANLTGADLRAARMPDADLRKADLRQAIATGADLGHANLSDARLRQADLHNASLRGATLTGADLREARLEGADMSRAALDRADCTRADLRNASLAFSAAAATRFRGADMRGTDLAGATDLDIRGAIIR